MKTNALLIIDPQNDFCNPGDANGTGKGSLYVDGAENDMERLALWLKKHRQAVDYVGITLDSHQPNDRINQMIYRILIFGWIKTVIFPLLFL